MNSIQRTGIVTVLPEMATCSEFHVRVPGVIRMRSAQSIRQRIFSHRNCQEMNVIAHQTIAHHRTA